MIYLYGRRAVFCRNRYIIYADVLALADFRTSLSVDNLHVVKIDVIDWHLWQAVEEECAVASVADDVADVDVAETRSAFVYLRNGLACRFAVACR